MSDQPTDIATLRAAVSLLASRYQLAGAAGLTFEGSRDMRKILGYKQQLDLADYRYRYFRGGLAGRIVDLAPNDTWSDGVELIEDEGNEDYTEFEQAVKDLDERLNLWSVFHRADRLAGIGRYGAILIGAPGALDTPLPARMTADQIVYLKPFAEDGLTVEERDLVSDSTLARYGMPMFYTMKALGGTRATTVRVHYTRVHHITDAPLDDLLYSQPRLERVWDLLDNLEKVTGGGSEAFFQRAHPGYHLNIDKDAKFRDRDKVLKDLDDEVEEFIHGLRRVVSTQGTEFTPLNATVAEFGKDAAAIIEQIAGSIAVPQRILLGSERGELASSQDKNNWDSRIKDRKTQVCGPFYIRPFFNTLINVGALPTPKQYSVFWPERDNQTDSDKMSIASKAATLNKLMGEIIVTRVDIRDRILGWGPIDESELARMEEEAQERLEKQQEMFEQGQSSSQPGELSKPTRVTKPAPKAAEAQSLLSTHRVMKGGRARWGVMTLLQGKK
jgi:uncharacterized protein